mmetsp:Transcript_17583/g.51070  ORF Transcript_17583/g.51070 Transcript_17583/m.51070 type:complete len:253 (-) Transcript_17583:3371-4129(-)
MPFRRGSTSSARRTGAPRECGWTNGRWTKPTSRRTSSASRSSSLVAGASSSSPGLHTSSGAGAWWNSGCTCRWAASRAPQTSFCCLALSARRPPTSTSRTRCATTRWRASTFSRPSRRRRGAASTLTATSSASSGGGPACVRPRAPRARSLDAGARRSPSCRRRSSRRAPSGPWAARAGACRVARASIAGGVRATPPTAAPRRPASLAGWSRRVGPSPRPATQTLPRSRSRGSLRLCSSPIPDQIRTTRRPS